MIQERRCPTLEDGRALELVEGTVASLIFQNEENGYTILRLERGGEELTLVGEMPGVSPGEYLSVQGRRDYHGPGAAAGGAGQTVFFLCGRFHLLCLRSHRHCQCGIQ